MKKYITNLYGNSSRSTAQNAQHLVANIAKSLGYIEISIGAFDPRVESELEQQKRIEGALTVTANPDDESLVVIQSPSWRGVQFDKKLVMELKNRVNHVVTFVHDLPSLMFADEKSTLAFYIEIYNLSDLIVLPSDKMKRILRENGLTSPVIIQEIWDHKVPSYKLSDPILKKELNFSGNINRFPFVKEWDREVRLKVFSDNANENTRENLSFEGWVDDEQLLKELSRGGFGLVWSEGHQRKYSEMNTSFKFSTYIAAGIPVIVNNEFSKKNFVIDQNIGLVAETLEEVEDIIKGVSVSQYNALVKNVRDISLLIKDGFFTKTLLLDIERTLFFKKI